MKSIFFAFWFVYFCVSVIPAKRRSILTLDKNSVCHIKRSCLECLKLHQCSWCENETKCYSAQLVTQREYCANSTVHHIDYGMSLKENAECSCARGNMERNCIPPGTAQEDECSGRGKCICGRCFCELNAEHQNSTKAVMGEYCEYDNFSCDGAKCNEGPYNINEADKNLVDPNTDITEPVEE